MDPLLMTWSSVVGFGSGAWARVATNSVVVPPKLNENFDIPASLISSMSMC